MLNLSIIKKNGLSDFQFRTHKQISWTAYEIKQNITTETLSLFPKDTGTNAIPSQLKFSA